MPEMDSASANELQRALSLKEADFSGGGDEQSGGAVWAAAAGRDGLQMQAPVGLRGGSDAAGAIRLGSGDGASVEELLSAIAGLQESSLSVHALPAGSAVTDLGHEHFSESIGTGLLGSARESVNGGASLRGSAAGSVAASHDASRQESLAIQGDAEAGWSEAAASQKPGGGGRVGGSIFSPTNSQHGSPDAPPDKEALQSGAPLSAAGPSGPSRGPPHEPTPGPATPAAQLRNILLGALRASATPTPIGTRDARFALLSHLSSG